MKSAEMHGMSQDLCISLSLVQLNRGISIFPESDEHLRFAPGKRACSRDCDPSANPACRLTSSELDADGDGNHFHFGEAASGEQTTRERAVHRSHVHDGNHSARLSIDPSPN
jgi:hypothetical protein